VTIEVDQDRCIGAGQCVMTAPEVFDQDDDGIVALLDASPPEPQLRLSREAATLCPAAAIAVRDDG
jgi:ferredoxin